MKRRNILKMDHFLSVSTLSNETILSLIHRALDYKNGATYHFLEPKFIANMFVEESTRTRYSFEMAQLHLGLKVLEYDTNSSSVSKGESLYDAALTFSALGVDALVIRSYDEHFYDQLLSSSNMTCSLINAGDGAGQHPSQSMMDLMTIYEHFGRFEGLKIGIVGDIVNSSVANSNSQALTRLGAQVYFSGPTDWLCGKCIKLGDVISLDDMVDTVDVLMCLRARPKERGLTLTVQQYFEQFGVTVERAKRMKENAIIMHTGPVNRNVDIADELVEDQKSKIIVQTKNSVFMNMAILEAILV